MNYLFEAISPQRRALLSAVAFAIAVPLAIYSPAADAFWWAAVKQAVKLVKPTKPDLKRKRQDWSDEADDYNPYHEWPDGVRDERHGRPYNERPGRGW